MVSNVASKKYSKHSGSNRRKTRVLVKSCESGLFLDCLELWISKVRIWDCGRRVAEASAKPTAAEGGKTRAGGAWRCTTLCIAADGGKGACSIRAYLTAACSPCRVFSFE